MTHTDDIRVVAISGSLRRSSTNSALVAAAAQMTVAGVAISVYEGLAGLPPFNPDLDQEGTPAAATTFREQLGACDAVLISSPEYAHGVPGALKNALDWLVGSGQLMAKPVALIKTSGRAMHAWESLCETLTVMSARVVPDASIAVPLLGRALDADGIVADEELSGLLRSVLETLAAEARNTRAARRAPLPWTPAP